MAEILRIILAAAFTFAVGGIYYAPEISPLAKIWIKENYPSGMNKEDMGRNIMVITVAAHLVLAICLNQYVRYKQIGLGRLVRMAMELWVMSVCLQAPHTLFSGHGVYAAAVDRVYDLIVILVQTLILGVNRFR